MLDAEFDPEENARGDSDSEAEYPTALLDAPQASSIGLLFTEVGEGSGWAAALLLGVSFGEDDDGNARMCDWDWEHVCYAAERGDADMVSLFLRAGADIEVESEDGDTLLLLACKWGHLKQSNTHFELAKILLGKGANPFAANDCRDTPLLWTCKAGDLQFAKMLLDKMAYEEQRWMGEHTSGANDAGDTPLLAALEAGNAELARELVNRGAEVWPANKQGNTPLLLACKAGDLEFANILLQLHSGVNYFLGNEEVSAANAQGETPLLMVCKAGDLEFAQVLLDRGADASVAVHFATERRDEKLLGVLVSAGADLDIKGPGGNTPLLLTCKAGDLDFAQMLLDNGADASAANAHGDTPLLAALAAGNAQLARELVARGAAVEVSRADGGNVRGLDHG